jgi:hypothetical protein
MQEAKLKARTLIRAAPIGRIVRAWFTASVLCACTLIATPDARDARITTDVRVRLAQYAELQAPNTLEVQTLHRVVYLRGLMATPFQVNLAASVAGQVSGVRQVENLISVENAR